VNTDAPTRTPKSFIENRTRGLGSTSTLATERCGNPRTTRGPPAPDVLAGVEPAFLSIRATSVFMSESIWTTKDKLRRGIYVAQKSGRRTLINFASVKAHAASLPAATFAPPRRQRQPDSLEPVNVGPAAPRPQRRRRGSRPPTATKSIETIA
jgi:hypothetical protein